MSNKLNWVKEQIKLLFLNEDITEAVITALVVLCAVQLIVLTILIIVLSLKI